MSTGLADNVRKYRRTAGLSQEGLAEAAELSLSTVRKVEQGGDVRIETLHSLARALGVTTSALFATEAPKPVLGLLDETNRRSLVELRKALMPAVGLAGRVPDPAEAAEVSVLHQGVREGHTLYWADQYDAVAKRLPRLLRSSEAAVAALEDEERRKAVVARCHILLLTGKYLTQVRQYDMAYHALVEAIRVAREADRIQLAATGVVGLCWLLLRQDRFEESEELAAATAQEVEPRMSDATPAKLAVWGELWLRVASASIRNNRPDVAREARRMAGTAASALSVEFTGFPEHWGGFGPVTAEMKAVEDLALVGDSRGVLRRADDGLLGSRAVHTLGRPTPPNWGRHRLDIAQAHIRLGSHQEAMDELTGLRRTSGAWLTHQPMARYVMTDILKTRKRTLTADMRDMAAHLGVAG
ncbi:helix-turn-helix domain-containing protein [Streptomyces huiliensis]|uniref:helix-turn-helix domain-containing protein n=1 Tax=Streptomyces huiliensis TaxID=2876027 RepID=UPI001CBFD9A4|nr:helix-turn-helix transcriptional regulator [Streptomyces huiliensis]MBZ4318855.1 helix-turn-helix domain-containing protein [Streptomyces huiliensis]